MGLGTCFSDDSRDDESLVANCDNNYVKGSSFPPFSNIDVDEDESDDESSVQYMASHYHEKLGRGKRNSRETGLASPGRRDQFRFLKVGPSSSASAGDKAGLSFSFDTEETHLEDASETSISTITSYGDDSSRFSSATGATAKKVRWLDEVEQQDLVVVHSLECDAPVTCRVVILLLLNNGTDANNNFEFLHCEFRLDQRLRVSDALAQITELVVGTPEHPTEVSGSRVEADKKAKTSTTTCPFRPFTSIYYHGRELINVCCLQDSPLQDGQSILVALRKGPEDRDILLKQSALLLSDRRLNKEIRKARISGRSLQVLLSSEEMLEKRERQTTALEWDVDALELSGDMDDDEVFANSTLWNLALDAVEDVDFDHTSFGTMEDEHSEWFDDSFFKGSDLFLQVDKKELHSETTKASNISEG